MKTFKKFIYPSYLILLMLSLFYVRSVLKSTPLKVDTEVKDKKESAEVKPVSVKLTIEYPGMIKTFNQRMKNEDTIIDLLEYLRLEKKIYFEVDSYTDKEVIINIDEIYKNDNNEWRVYYFDDDVTSEINKLLLTDEGEYRLKYQKTNL